MALVSYLKGKTVAGLSYSYDNDFYTGEIVSVKGHFISIFMCPWNLIAEFISIFQFMTLSMLLFLLNDLIHYMALQTKMWGESTGHQWISNTKGQQSGELMCSLMWALTKCWTKGQVASILRHHNAHVTPLWCTNDNVGLWKKSPIRDLSLGICLMLVKLWNLISGGPFSAVFITPHTHL